VGTQSRQRRSASLRAEVCEARSAPPRPSAQRNIACTAMHAQRGTACAHAADGVVAALGGALAAAKAPALLQVPLVVLLCSRGAVTSGEKERRGLGGKSGRQSCAGGLARWLGARLLSLPAPSKPERTAPQYGRPQERTCTPQPTLLDEPPAHETL
jgi:hypothetical protein